MCREGALKPGDIEPFATRIIQVKPETVLGLLRKGAPEPAYSVKRLCCSAKLSYVGRKTVLATFIEGTRAAQGGRFDRIGVP